MSNNTLIISAANGVEFRAYAAGPADQTRPVLLLLQYICGVNAVMRKLADGFAQQGYRVLVPDLYWRQAPGITLIDDPTQPNPAEQAQALALNDGFNDTLALQDLEVCLAYARQHAGGNGSVGTLGYCLGGRLAYLMACHTSVDCAVSYYGVNLEQHAEAAATIHVPTLLHIAGSDALVPPETQASILNSVRHNPRVSALTHGGVNHAFALPGGANFSPNATTLANQTSLAFLHQHLPAA